MTRQHALFLALLAAACNPFNPNLGDDPFLCGIEEPRCPTGYVAVQEPTRCVCQRGVDLPDAGPFSCNDDSAITNDPGGNDSYGMATATTIDATMTDSFQNMAICPDTDTDVFSMSITTGNTTIQAVVLYSPAQGQLSLRILDSQGFTLAQGTDGVDRVTATYLTPSTGTFYAEVSSPAGVQNNYRLELSTTL